MRRYVDANPVSEIRFKELLALVAINNAIAADGNAKDIAKARDLVAEGDRDIAPGSYYGINDYRDGIVNLR